MPVRGDDTNVNVAQLEQLTRAMRSVQQSSTEQEARTQIACVVRALLPAHDAFVLLADDPDTGQPTDDVDAGRISVPLVAMDGTRLGTLRLVGRKDAATDEALLALVAQLASQALESIRLRTRFGEQEERLRLALEAASLGTWEHIPSTHATHWDARSKAMFGLAADQELDFELYQRSIHPDDAEGVFAGIAKAVDPSGKGECSLQYRIRAVDGVERWVEAHGRCVFDEQRVPQRINGTLVDITDRKRAEDALRESSRRKDEFLAVLGHELRNPLAPMRTALELMRDRVPEQAERERDVLERQLRHMMRLVDDLLDVSRIARGTVTLRTEVLELEQVVARAVEMASPLLEERAHALSVDVARGIVIEGDAVRLSQIVSNLLNNAARYTPSGGAIAVRASALRGWATLEVEDNGIGIDPEDVARIFEPFVQSARSHEQGQSGLGLGLSLVRDLAKLHGGSVEASSAGVGKGSRFTLRLPLASAQHASSAPSAHERRSKAASPCRVLLVDDNEDAADLLGMFLEDRGHEVCVAYDGPRALEVAERLAPDVAVVDLGLPVMDGFEVAARLRQKHGTALRLIALTGYGQPSDRERTRAAGFDVHLVKPVDPRELEAMLR